METGSIADWFSGTATALAVIVALGGYGFSEWQRRRDKRDAQRQAGHQIGIKLLKVLNGTNDIRRHLWAEYSGPALGGEGATELWRTINPLIGIESDPTISLDASEISLLINADAADFLLELMLATSRYQSLVESMKEYKIRYQAIYELSPAPVEMEGHVGRHLLTTEQYMRMRPYSVALEMLIQNLRGMSKDNFEVTSRLAGEFNPIMKRYFKEKFLALGVGEEAVTTASVNS